MEHDKLGFYLSVARTIQKLKEVRANARIDAEGDDSLMELLWRLQRLLGESTSNQDLAGLRPFSQLRLFQERLFEFHQELNQSLGDDDNPLQNVALGRQRHRQLQDLTGDLERVFREEVESRVVFISPARPGLLEFSSPNTFLHDATDRQCFDYLPRIAQRNFEDAGKCLVYGLAGAAISMSLQAVEATIRFFYMRHGGENKSDRRGGYSEELPDWAHMINWRRNQSPPFLPGDEVGQRHCHALLDSLRHRYRNAIAHGRAYFETGRPDASINEAETVFRDCWAAARLLAAETPRREQLRFRVKISEHLSFDTAVASFLYSWNPELPLFGAGQIKSDPSLSPNELIDTTVEDTDFWPRRLQAQPTESLSRRVRACFRMQSNYAATMDPLIDFVDKCAQSAFRTRFDPKNPREDDVSLLDLFQGIEPHLKHVRKQEGDAQPTIGPEHILVEAWKMLDKFVLSSLHPEGPSLVTDLNMQAVFNTLCILDPSVPANSVTT
jgi:hypothetical protein